MDNIQIGKLIAELRKKQGLTQQQLADKLNLSNKTISKWETGLGSPDISNLLTLANTLDISVDELLQGTLDKTKNVKTTDVPKREKAIIVLASCIGAIFGILAYNFSWLG